MSTPASAASPTGSFVLPACRTFFQSSTARAPSSSIRRHACVATVNPEIWSDLFLSNHEALEAVLTRLIDRLTGYRDALHAADAEKLRALLAEGCAAKEKEQQLED